jgi:hypothetical protein
MIAGTQDEVDLFLQTVLFFTVEADLIPALEKASAALEHRKVAAGSLAVERSGSPAVADGIV